MNAEKFSIAMSPDQILKEEFRGLDEEEQQLKALLWKRGVEPYALQCVRRRKAEIAREIFGHADHAETPRREAKTPVDWQMEIVRRWAKKNDLTTARDNKKGEL
jgi:hypothetical protein